MDERKTIAMFCANCQVESAHVIDIDGNGEILLTCLCGRFVKYPRGTDVETLKLEIAAHKESNAGQISIESIEVEKAELVKGLTESAV